MGVKADVDAARSGSTSDAELLEFLAQRACVIATELVYVPSAAEADARATTQRSGM